MAVGPESILDGRFKVEEPLGSGGMGAVWRGYDTRLKRKVAIKVLRNDDADPQMASRFGREAEILARVSHPGITVVHDCGQHEGQLFIVMELLEGSDLAAVLESYSGGLPVARTVNLTRQAAEALAAAHGQGVVHRDIKPANLFIVRDDHLKICDFGIAKTVNSDWTLTQPDRIMGTPAYMSPEQWRGAGAVDHRSDLYSLGCVVYEMLTGYPPFGRGQDWSRADSSRWNVPPAPPRGIEPVPQALSSLVLGLLDRDPRGRPQSASDVAETLKAIQAGAPGARRRQEQRSGREAPRARPQSADPPPKAPPQQLTAEELRVLGPKAAADLLQGIRSDGLAAGALKDLKDREAAAILELLSHGRAATLLLAFNDPVRAARVLALLKPARQAEVVACFGSADDIGQILDVMPPRSAARLSAAMQAPFLADVLAVMERPHALKVLDAMDIARRRSAIEHLTSSDDALALRALAQAQLEEAERLIQVAGVTLRQAAARRQVQEDLMPWTMSVRSAAWLLVATTVAFDVGAAALNWESWPWLFLFVPAALGSGGAAFAAGSARFAKASAAAAAAGLFLVASVAAVLLVLGLVPAVAGVLVGVVAALVSTGLVLTELDDEEALESRARRDEGLGRRARLGDDGSA